MDQAQRQIMKKMLAEKASPVEDAPEQAEPFDLRTAGPLELQQMIGNKATQSLLSDSPQAGGGSTFIQTKLEVTAADDQYEAEADAVAKDVVRDGMQRQAMEEEEEPLQAKRLQRQPMEEEEMMQAKRLQRQPMEEEEEPLQAKRLQRQAMEEEEEMMQAKRLQRADEQVDMSGSFVVGGDVEEQIKNTGGSGQALSDENRSFFEKSMGYDFSNVNVHADAQSDTLNRSLQARAFTHGSDIYFRQGEYNPGSSAGKELLAHELTHVVQQGGAQVQTKKEDE